MKDLKRRYHAIPWFASPLAASPPITTAPVATPLLQQSGHSSDESLKGGLGGGEDGSLEAQQRPRRDDDTPKFREREKALPIELFYDLFFVANLSSFTGVFTIDRGVGAWLL